MATTTPARSQSPFILDDTYVRQDEHGRFSLNDLHQAAGGEQRHQPRYWLENKQTKELIAELENEAGIPALTSGIPLVKSQEGRGGGTYVARELVYAYAMWISPAFHLQVIRTFDAVATGKNISQPLVGRSTGLPLAQLTGLQDQAWKLITRLKNENQPELRESLYEQLQDVYADMGKQAPALISIGSPAPLQPKVLALFWQAIAQLQSNGVELNHLRRSDQQGLNLRQCIKAAATLGFKFDAGELRTALRESLNPKFIDVHPVNSAITGHTVRCWVFETSTAEGSEA